MRAIAVAMLVMAFIFCGGCKKGRVATVSGAINGVPVQTLYGNSGSASDYILLDTTGKQLSYNGVLYTYLIFSGNDVSIIISVNAAEHGTLTIAGSKTTLIIIPTTTIFTSTQYSN